MKISNYIKKNKYTIIFIFTIICISLGFCVFSRTEPDYYWHLTAGKYMFDNHTILTHDIFSWYLYGTYWFSHEWLFEIIIYISLLLFGKYSVFIYTFVCFCTLLLFIFITNKENFFKIKLFSMIWFTFIILFAGFMTGRPHMIGFILFAITIYVLYDLYNDEDSKKLYILPVITILWTNIHGGSSNLSYILCLLFLICSLINIKSSKLESKRKSKKTIYKYLVIMILCMLCINIGPHSYNMFIYPYMNLGDTLMVNNISEWQATVLSDNSHLPFFIFAFVVLVMLLVSKKKIRLIDFVLYSCMLFLGLKSIRFWPYIYITMSYSIYYYIPSRKDDKGTELVYLVLGLFPLVLFIGSFNNIMKATNKMSLNKNTINILKGENPKRLFNNYDFGGELIYNDIKVFIDGRADLYSKHNLKDVIDISNLNGNYEKKIKKYDFDYFYVDRTFRINDYLKKNDNYQKITCDKYTCIYKKKTNY